MKLLSVIVPCYNEQENIRDFYNELMKSETFFKEQGTDIELIYINDGSVDKTVDEVKELNDKDKRVKLVSFSHSYQSGNNARYWLQSGTDSRCTVLFS